MRLKTQGNKGFYLWNGTKIWESISESYTFNSADKGMVCGRIGINNGNVSVKVNGKTILSITESGSNWYTIYIPIKRGDIVTFLGTNYENTNIQIGTSS